MYTEYYINFNREVSEEETEIITALLGQSEFESFQNNQFGVKAYIQNALINKEEIDLILVNIKNIFNVDITINEIEDVNWNAEWEKSYDPVFVGDSCVIRAPFHKITPKPDFEVIINPKMAFGTGHHETTYLISDILFSERIRNKEICDAGTGSGVFAIIASLLGAKSIYAYDIDQWSYNNTKENLKINKINNVVVKKGNSDLIKGKDYDLILANINRNILLNDVAQFSLSLREKGTLIVSGFYAQDLPIIIKEFEKNNLKLDTFKKKNNWIAAIFRKVK